MANIPISSFTAAANATGIGMSGFSLTGANAQSMLDLAGTWNTSGTPTGLKLNVTDTASNASSNLMDLQVGGSSRFRVQKDGAIFFGYASILPGTGWNGLLRIAGGSLTIGNAGNGINLPSDGFLSWGDVGLTRDAANTLAQRNGVNAQTFRVYNTFTDASNYERAEVHWVGNVFRVGTYAAGTGTGRTLTFLTSGVERWSINASTGHLLAAADNTYDIGASGANRPRNLFLGSNALFNNGSGVGRASADIQFYDSAVNVVKDLQLIGKFLSFQEQTAPAAPATNGVRIYAEDNGSGKTRIMALFATGAAVQLAIEP